jgi:hypothetical protein
VFGKRLKTLSQASLLILLLTQWSCASQNLSSEGHDFTLTDKMMATLSQQVYKTVDKYYLPDNIYIQWKQKDKTRIDKNVFQILDRSGYKFYKQESVQKKIYPVKFGISLTNVDQLVSSRAILMKVYLNTRQYNYIYSFDNDNDLILIGSSIKN